MKQKHPPQQKLTGLLAPYWRWILPLIVLTIAANALTLWLPRLLSHAIDAFLTGGTYQLVLALFVAAAWGIFALTYGQSVLQTYASERVARDLRNRLSDKISSQSFAQVQAATSARLLTNLTSDIDAVKNYVSQAIVTVVSSVFLILGGSVLLLGINWKLGLAVLTTLPIIAATFIVILKQVRVLFLETREVIDWLNKVINESILGAALIRVLNSQKREHGKFAKVNRTSRDIGIRIVKLFAAMIPIITFASNLAILIILALGGHFVIQGTMTLGEFASFNSYMAILIFPIVILGFVSNLIAQAQASYGRISAALNAPAQKDAGHLVAALEGHIQVSGARLTFQGRDVLKGVSLDILPKSKVAILGPTAAGKTQLLNLLIGLVSPDEGSVTYDGEDIGAYQKEAFYRQVGLVFQDSILFNVSLRENIAFNAEVSEEALWKAIGAAELAAFIRELPDGLDTVVSERGTSLSGGQKQRVMLARALALNPKILLLDDFTARVDARTERKILENIARDYPDVTLVSVTQKVAAVEQYDQIVVLMEGEVVASGTHEELLKTSTEYVQICDSQKSTSAYELLTE